MHGDREGKMKKVLALLLAFAMLLSTQETAYAAEPEGQTRAGNTGQVNVVIEPVLALQGTAKFLVSLTDSQGQAKNGEIQLEGNDSAAGSLNFEGLAAGKYTLTVKADGFADYSQELSVESQAYTIRLTTGRLGSISYEAGKAYPGIVRIGDVNGDGRIDDADKKALLDSIQGGNSGVTTDLNGDGIVNLVDLEYFARGFGEKAETAQVEKAVPAVLIEPSEGSNTKAEGDLKGLLRNQGSVILKPENGGGISGDNSVALCFDFTSAGNASEADGILIGTSADNPVTEAEILVEYEDENGVADTEKIGVKNGVQYLLINEKIKAEVDKQGNIRISLGSQVAIKKVTLIIKGVQNNNLAEISSVEFVNGMEERIPQPEMNIPEGFQAEAGNAAINLSWKPSVNVTGYEVLIRQGDMQQTILTTKTSLNVTSFGGKGLVNYQPYKVSVQSVNGSWRSGYCAEEEATPKPAGKPDRPDNVNVTGKYLGIAVSWKQAKDAQYYNLYYKESSEEGYRKIEQIKGTSYTISDLKDGTEYMVYVTAVNEFGESAASLTKSARTGTLEPARMPQYNLINTGQKGEKGAHILSAVMNGEMRGSTLDTQEKTAWGTVDHDPASYYRKGSWDDGGFNPMSLQHGLTYEFDQTYKLDTIAFLEGVPQDMKYHYVKVRYWGEDGQEKSAKASLQKKNDADGRLYYVVKLSEPVEAKKIQFGLARYLADGNIAVTVSEVYFYYYDTLMDEILALYEDDLHTMLRADVNQGTIDALRSKVQAVDPVSGEYHPDRVLLERELATAEAILKDEGLKAAAVEIHNGITTSDVGRGFGGLNAWQPLGVTASAGEEIMVYVGHNTRKTGEATSLKLVATQYHSESSPISAEVADLKVGANKVTIPEIWASTGVESGGALYVQYSGNDVNDRYAVRVSGGAQVPRLDLYQVTGEEERLRRVRSYVEELTAYVARMETLHGELHQNEGSFDRQNCILGASDILLDTMLLSLPAEQILSGAGSGDAGQKAQNILNSMNAMEDMMYLFYQHKGLNASAAEEINRIPKGHLNIRYQRMFSGAFMYAAGNHIGIEWGSAPGMMSSVPVQSDNGKYVSGSYFGWGIAHEIGHCINQGTYAIAEITNNYFAVLAQAKDNNTSVRFSYDKVYEKVTSGAKGMDSNVFTQLAMYWQLHLAYDKGYNFKTYENYEEQLANLFYARVDTYARNTAKAPAPGGVSLKLAGNRDQDFMRLACAAAEKNILDFFERWGMTPDQDTRSYAAQFPGETRAICYASDDARVYSLQGGGSVLGTEGGTEAVGSAAAIVNSAVPNQVDLSFEAQGIPQGDVLGFEIVRCTISGGETVREPAGFTMGNTFSDIVSVNNRVVRYEITLIDKYLNRSAVKTLEPLKIEHDGRTDKSFYTVETQNLKVDGEEPAPGGGDTLCSANESEIENGIISESSTRKLLDNDTGTVYQATASGTAWILLELNREMTMSGLGYALGDGMAGTAYEIQVRSGAEWISVAEGTFSQQTAGKVYFANQAGEYMGTYETDAVKLVLKTGDGALVSLAELDVLGPVGDNVSFRKAGENADKPVIGRLAEDYQYDTDGHVIPKGSIVFVGAYKGNPAYNVLILYDQNGAIVGGTDGDALKAQQIILADPPAAGDIGNVSDGTWVYWIEPDQNVDLTGIEKVRAELYRVNDAHTNEGQRLVSDTLYETMPSQLPEIRLEGREVQ